MPIKGERYSGDYYAKLEALGFIIGEAIDDLFMKVTMPQGWIIQGTSHSLWSDLVDEKGRKRTSMFYKSAFYDRDAFLTFHRRFSISSEIPDFDEELFREKDEMIVVGHEPTMVPDEEALKQLEKSGRKVSRRSRMMIEYIAMEGTVMYWGDGIPMKRVNKPIYAPNPDYVKLTGYEKYALPFHFEVHDHDGTVLYTSEIVKTDYEWSSDKHREFFAHRDEICENVRQQCKEWLNTSYPDWENVLSHWN